ncbi:MAG: leucine--tRNA ligase [Candidatus Parcubacteria bacterium]|nr:MAG: leucine--tRNA ligase [Candidatus Parcubacteria bacterium]
MKKYNFKKIEKKWLSLWIKKRLWKVKDSLHHKKKKYILDMFPYPSGEGLHVGHVEGYTATDILTRFYRMNGYNVLHPIGFDAFGLPAENYALKKKKNPSSFVPKNIARYRKQLLSLGFSYDWDREISTTDPEYYKWTQWMFLQMYKHGLVYEKEAPINFCPNCKTGLADEESIGGKCERCETPIEVRFLKQWHIKITAYAERLLEDLEELDWPEHIKEMQKNWIGKSEGYEVKFALTDYPEPLKIFTTRLDTIFGATFIVLSVSHPLIFKITKPDYMMFMEDYVRNELKKEKLGIIDKEISGIFTGSYAINPMNGFKIPIWVSNYVLSGYGTGAIMGVPAHDERDWNFAKKFNLDIIKVIKHSLDEETNADFTSVQCFTEDGILINSDKYSGLTSSEAREQIGAYLISLGLAEKKIYYKLRDWIFSRQRYWGEPIPLIRCNKCGIVPVPEKDLPVVLPKVKSYQPTGTGESPLKNIHHWVRVKCPSCRSIAERETQTMPQWAGSCWYFLAYILKKKQSSKKYKISFDLKKLKYWMPVDIYVGGVEHAVLHLLYARFWNKFLYDLNLVPCKEPFLKLFNQGIILGPDGRKMSKSKGNVINPDDIIKHYGADTLRMFEMFLGPLEVEKPWSSEGIKGIERFLQRVWKLSLWLDKVYKTKRTKLLKNKAKEQELLIALHKLIYEVTQSITSFRFNIAIAKMMIFEETLRRNLENNVYIAKDIFLTFIKLLFPFAPFISQEIWHLLGKKNFLDKEKWPQFNPKLLSSQLTTYIIQVNGKKRGVLEVKADNLSVNEAKKLVQSLPLYKKYLENKTIKQIIFVKGKVINFVLADAKS